MLLRGWVSKLRAARHSFATCDYGLLFFLVLVHHFLRLLPPVNVNLWTFFFSMSTQWFGLKTNFLAQAHACATTG